jgi:hypothetical protein
MYAQCKIRSKNLKILLKKLKARNYVYLKFSAFAPFLTIFCVCEHF